MTEIFLNIWASKGKAYFSGLSILALRWVGNSFNTKPGYLQLCLSLTSCLHGAHRSTKVQAKGPLRSVLRMHPAICIHVSLCLSQLYVTSLPNPYSLKKLPPQSPVFQAFQSVWCFLHLLSLTSDGFRSCMSFKPFCLTKHCLWSSFTLLHVARVEFFNKLCCCPENHSNPCLAKESSASGQYIRELPDRSKHAIIRFLRTRSAHPSHTRNNSHCPHSCHYAGK